MSVNKMHDEFSPVDMKQGWELPPGYEPDSGVEQKILAGALDEKRRTGTRSSRSTRNSAPAATRWLKSELT